MTGIDSGKVVAFQNDKYYCNDARTMFNLFFPYILHLHIFQLDEYSVSKFLSWVSSHFFTRHTENKKPLVWTQKARALFIVSLTTAVVLVFFLTLLFHLIGFIIGLFFATQAYLFLIIASYILKPYETRQKNNIKLATEKKVLSLKNLKVIGITGSYGKTSVKEFLYHILRTEFRTLKTPESYNTPYGIAKVVRLELDDSYEYFVCEMGAYRVGDIKEITDMMHPTYGILTGINEQHLETFGSLENTTKGKFELIASLPRDGFGIVNIDNERIRHNYHKYTNTEIIPYGLTDDKFSLTNIRVSEEGTRFDLILDGKPYHAQTELLGNPNLANIVAAATMSYLLGMKPENIVKAIKTLQSVPHRLEIKQQANMTIIDDAYNSNIDGFKESIQLLSQFKNRPTVFVTPGIVDLGAKTFSVHKELGAKLTDIDHVFLIGESERTKGLKEGIKEKDKIVELKSIRDVWGKIEEMKLEKPVVLLENDLPDNY